MLPKTKYYFAPAFTLFRGVSLALAVLVIQTGTIAAPNVILILTDDQGMGDLSLYGNPVVQTPNLDSLAGEGVSFDQFHVTSMCSPTRAALLTGLNPLRNGTISTCQGLSTLREGTPTLAEVLQGSGYATALFGKWHLGRNWPNRPEDRGFEETLTLHGFGTTGIGSRWNNDYVDTWVVHNGKEQQLDGFCTDAFFDEAIAWIDSRKDKEQPFFALISTNAPHFPFWAPEDWTEPYADSLNPEFFAMVKNLDDNVGRLNRFLEQGNLVEDTVLIFMTDNGPVGGLSTHNAGMTGGKTQPWEGGHRVPLFVRYPAGGIEGGRVVRGLAFVTDLFPTLMDLCGVPIPDNLDLDGISLRWIMRNGAGIPERQKTMLIRQHELVPEFAAVMRGDWRLLWGNALYNIRTDLAQEIDLARERPEIFISMWKPYQEYYQKWSKHALNAQAHKIGSKFQEEVILDASAWIGKRADGQVSVRQGTGRFFGPDGGTWKVEAVNAGRYTITLRRWPIESGLALDEGAPPFHTRLSGKPLIAGKAFPITRATLEVDGRLYEAVTGQDPSAISFSIQLDAGEHLIKGTFRDTQGNALCGAFYAHLTKAGAPSSN